MVKTRKRQKIKKYRKTSRNYFGRGGAKFKYTTDKDRQLWIKSLFGLGNNILGALKKIQWNEYTYEGPHKVLVAKSENGYGGYTGESMEFDEFETNIKARASNTPYFIFGGSACEIWNKLYPEAANLYEFVDPTADIDIEVAPPFFEVDQEFMMKYGDSSLNLMDGDNYSPLSDNFSKWLFEKAVGIAKALVPHFQAANLSLPSKEDTSETSFSDINKEVGPILVSRLYKNNMIKIQLTTKLATGYVDHFLEFIIATNEKIESQKDAFENKTTKIKDIYIENVDQLLFGQIKGIKDRQEIGENYRHKLINHYGRLVYLSKLLEYLVKKNLHESIACSQLGSLLAILKRGFFKDSNNYILALLNSSNISD